MSERNAAIKDYICAHFVQEDSVLLAAKKHAHEAQLPDIAVPENVGKLLYMLTKLQKPQRILEIGTLAGYSTLWLASGAPEAKIYTLEMDPKHAQVAEANFRAAQLNHRIEIIVGDATKTMETWIKRGEKPFDLIFLDADKEGYAGYLPLILKLSRSGTLLLTDNLIPKDGEINKPDKKDQISTGTYKYNEILASHPNIETILATTIVGKNGRTDALGVSIIK